MSRRVKGELNHSYLTDQYLTFKDWFHNTNLTSAALNRILWLDGRLIDIKLVCIFLLLISTSDGFF